MRFLQGFAEIDAAGLLSGGVHERRELDVVHVLDRQKLVVPEQVHGAAGGGRSAVLRSAEHQGAAVRQTELIEPACALELHER